LKANNKVCVNFSTDLELRHQDEEVACSYSMKYRSVLAYGHVEFIDDLEEKSRVLDIIMQQYTDRTGFKYNGPAVKNVLIYRIVIERMEGRVYGY
ncbi:MAG: pyridoxamine 5'-phosphate oxidase family protein, partial [Bacteroidales bacterium]|nr:pyridoxamine 5'-phosphate oxidase family protein [Bacteroidales bacterium]